MNKRNPYQDWLIQRWETPASALEIPCIESLADTDHLTITVTGRSEEKNRRLKFIFQRPYIYRNADESYRNALWEIATSREYGNTWILKQSDLFDWLMMDDLAKNTFQSANTFVIVSNDDVIEVVAVQTPEIKDVSVDQI